MENDNIDNERLKEIEDEVNYILEEEGEDMDVNVNNIDQSDKLTDNSRYQNKYTYSSQYNSNFENSKQNNHVNSNFSETSPEIYNFISSCKEKYNAMEGRLNDINKFKMEIGGKNKKIFELESTITGYKYEITRLLKKNEENMRLNHVWESTFKDIKSKIIKLEEEKISFRDEIDKWKNKHADLQFKNDILVEKSKINEENLNNLKKMQNDYEKTINDLKKEYKNKEDNLKKQYKDLEEGVMNKMRDQENDFMEEKENLLEKIRFLEKGNSKHLDTISEVNDKLQEISIDFKCREKELNSLLEEKDEKIQKIECKLQKLSEEANEHISKLNENLAEINEKIQDKERTYLTEINNLERNLKSEIERNIEYENFIKSLENKKKSDFSENQSLNSNLQVENAKLQKDISFLKKILANKQEEVDKLKQDVNKTIHSLNNSDFQTTRHIGSNMTTTLKALSKKEEEIQNLILKNSELEKKNTKLLKEINQLQDNFEHSCLEYKCEINKKNEEIHILKLNYEKLLSRFNSKLENINY